MNTATPLNPFRSFIDQSILRETSLRTAPTIEGSTGYDAILQQAETSMKNGPLAQAHILRFWADIKWSKFDSQRVTTDAEMARDGTNRINLYPSLISKPKDFAAFVVIKEFGRLLFSKASEAVKRRWVYKLALPTDAQIQAVQGKLNPQYTSYRAMVESFATAMDRYVALNVANALIANGVPYAQSQNVKIQQWGPTQEYCNRRRYHMLIPLVSAYGSKDIYDDFGCALADWVMGMNGVTESSVAEALHELIKDIAEAAR
jgi:hypothetical protein